MYIDMQWYHNALRETNKPIEASFLSETLGHIFHVGCNLSCIVYPNNNEDKVMIIMSLFYVFQYDNELNVLWWDGFKNHYLSNILNARWRNG